MRVSNSKARQYVEKLEEFQGSNMFGKWLDVGNGRTETNLLYVVTLTGRQKKYTILCGIVKKLEVSLTVDYRLI